MKILTATAIICLTFFFSKVYSQSTDTVPDPRVFSAVEKEAAFPGGDVGWRKFLEKNLNPNTPVDNGAPVGLYTVMVQFVVDKEGKVSDIKAVTQIGYGMEQEVLRIIRQSGAWEPAMVGGSPVAAYRKQPVVFMVEEDGFDISLSPLYAGEDNEISIAVRKVKNEDLFVTISKGTIKRGANGKFIARVPTPGRVIITVYNAKKNNKELGMASLEVKQR